MGILVMPFLTWYVERRRNSSCDSTRTVERQNWDPESTVSTRGRELSRDGRGPWPRPAWPAPSIPMIETDLEWTVSNNVCGFLWELARICPCVSDSPFYVRRNLDLESWRQPSLCLVARRADPVNWSCPMVCRNCTVTSITAAKGEQRWPRQT